jgi:hypothetical protein
MGEPAVKLNESAVAELEPKSGAGGASNVLDVAEAEKVLPLPLMLKAASEKYGKPLQQIVMEIARLGFGAGRITAEEYFTLRLFDDANIRGDKAAFCGMASMRKLWPEVNFMQEWFGPMTDKLAFDTLLLGFGYPAIRTRAYYSDQLPVPALRNLRSKADLRAFLTDPASYPFFSKPRSSSLSLGSASAEGYDAETGVIRLQGGKSVGLDRFIDDIAMHFGAGYMFQERVKPHAGVRAICGDRLATVRIYTINGEHGPEVFRIVWKVPGGKNVADNFWRKGNILAAVDYETGTITRAIQGFAMDQVELEKHPDTGHQLVGIAIPNFQTCIDVALEAARLFADIRVIGWDIAPTEEGAVIVEGNYAPEFKLVQMAERRGIFDQRMNAFMAFCRDRKKAHKAGLRARMRMYGNEDYKKFKKSAWMR